MLMPIRRNSSFPKPTPAIPSGVDEQALAKARSQAEKYKPKNPSGLRMSSHYSSPLTPSTPPSPSTVAPSPAKATSGVRPSPATPAVASPLAKPPTNAPTLDKPSNAGVSTPKTDDVFGRDHFAEDAKWLYDQCPSGDIREVKWPEKAILEEDLDVVPTAIEFVREHWKEANVNEAYEVFNKELEEFTRNLV